MAFYHGLFPHFENIKLLCKQKLPKMQRIAQNNLKVFPGKTQNPHSETDRFGPWS